MKTMINSVKETTSKIVGILEKTRWFRYINNSGCQHDCSVGHLLKKSSFLVERQAAGDQNMTFTTVTGLGIAYELVPIAKAIESTGREMATRIEDDHEKALSINRLLDNLDIDSKIAEAERLLSELRSERERLLNIVTDPTGGRLLIDCECDMEARYGERRYHSER